ncbi:stabilizer of axonemal microtubules 1-like isoform X1 [Bombus impatiens]|uniref:Stabilizer of axonemal microtubules 1-like isoform X1 n=2 Tax=Bombus impatiens TaxID=132113 RepID=A0A6P8LJ48_BOMIM|nr:stabilizer of axonemal microtubules 1-like isoform X1 [Bombus impatiens]XP_033178967.1 stabilizer of axonemal microtubules 1-like isoform X1 [Bombus impatiens]
MQICTINPPECKQQQQRRQSVIEERSKIKINHDDCCNCCCCCTTPQRTCYKYVQPEIPKSFAPIRHYWKSGIPMDNNTTYRLSYWECPSAPVDPILPRNWLATGDGEISDETTYKNSYFEHLCVKPESPCIPCEKQWLGRGPIQDVTTQKHDYTWKSIPQIEAYKAENNLYCAPAPLLDDTTYKLSYYQSGCNLPALSYAPIRKYVKPDIPMEDHTTYKLSYWPNESMKEEPLWQRKEYSPPVEPMDGCTTYKLSYWPHSEKRRSPIILQPTDNILNAGCCTEDNTTYRLSYFGCGGDKRTPIRQPNNIQFSPCSLSYDTVHRMSFLGNWCVKQDPPIIPCDKQFLGRGPIQEVTTQKHDYTWKNIPLEPDARRADNLVPACTPIECCTTYRLSYLENDLKSLTPIHNYAPVRTCCLPDVPMEAETVMQLSYQPVECADKVEKPWSERPPYQLPVTPMEDNTTYNKRFSILLYERSSEQKNNLV